MGKFWLLSLEFRPQSTHGLTFKVFDRHEGVGGVPVVVDDERGEVVNVANSLEAQTSPTSGLRNPSVRVALYVK